MIKITAIILSLFFMFGNTNTPTEMKTEVDNFKVSSLSKEGQDAYEILIKASQFEDAKIGIAGTLSIYAKNFEILLRQEKADAAFKSILKNGTTAAQLYALCGIYFTDHAHFEEELEKYKNSDKKVQTISGCLIGEEKISEIVVSNSENVAIIEPTQTLEDFWKKNKTSYNIDIANGGYPATFKHFAEKDRKEK